MYAEPEIYSENDSARERARKHSREIIKERNDTTGGSRVSWKRNAEPRCLIVNDSLNNGRHNYNS